MNSLNYFQWNYKNRKYRRMSPLSKQKNVEQAYAIMVTSVDTGFVEPTIAHHHFAVFLSSTVQFLLLPIRITWCFLSLHKQLNWPISGLWSDSVTSRVPLTFEYLVNTWHLASSIFWDVRNTLSFREGAAELKSYSNAFHLH